MKNLSKKVLVLTLATSLLTSCENPNNLQKSELQDIKNVPVLLENNNKFKIKSDNYWYSILSSNILYSYYPIAKDVPLKRVADFVGGTTGLGCVASSISLQAELAVPICYATGVSQGISSLISATGQDDNLKVDIYQVNWWSSSILGAKFILVPSASNFNSSNSEKLDTYNNWSNGTNVAKNQEKRYYFNMEAGKKYEISVKNNYGDSDLYTSNQKDFNRNNAIGKSEKGGSEIDKISFKAPFTGENYITVFGYSDANFNIRIADYGYGW